MSCAIYKFTEIYRGTNPLRVLITEGKVILNVTNGVGYIKKSYPNPLLVIQTSESLGIGRGGLLVTLIGYGSKLLDTNNLKATPLILMGLTSKAAKLLIEELQTHIKQI